MRVLGRGSETNSVIVELTGSEWRAIGGKTVPGRHEADLKSEPPKLFRLVEKLEEIRRKTPDLEYIRASFEAFLLLTGRDGIEQALKDCSVALPVEVPEVPEVPEGTEGGGMW